MTGKIPSAVAGWWSRDARFMNRGRFKDLPRGYLRIMIRRASALVLLLVMAFLSLPAAWTHDCARAEAAHHEPEGLVVHADDHCPVCDQVMPSVPAEGQVRMALRIAGPVERGEVVVFRALPGAMDAGSVRGPPQRG